MSNPLIKHSHIHALTGSADVAFVGTRAPLAVLALYKEPDM